jgi:plasmid stabilization system protein ParE
MKRLDLHKDIEADLDRIWNWLALDQDAPEAANRVRAAIEASFTLVALHPGIGSFRWKQHPSLTEVRMFVVPQFRNYLIFYREKPDAVEIVAVLHGKRDLPRRLIETRRFD